MGTPDCKGERRRLLKQGKTHSKIPDAVRLDPKTLTGNCEVPMSKSILHRALIMAFLAGNLDLVLFDEENASDDILATKKCLEILDEARKEGKEEVTLFCNESGSTLRFMIPLAAVLGIRARFEGAGRLGKRPIQAFDEVFRVADVDFHPITESANLPAIVSGVLPAGIYSIEGKISSQYISGLLMALSYAKGASTVLLSSPLTSAPYVDLTIEVMRAFGVTVARTKDGFYISGTEKPNRAIPFTAEGDYSQAAFWLVANYLGAAVCVTNLPRMSLQGDRAITTLLAELARRERAIEDGEALAPMEMDARDCPDLVPVFAVACAATACVVRIIHAERLVEKESNRLVSTVTLLRALGADVLETDDGMEIHGKKMIGNAPVFSKATINPHHDHRLVMAAAVAAVRADGPIIIEDAASVAKSYPRFFEDYQKLGGFVYGINVG